MEDRRWCWRRPKLLPHRHSRWRRITKSQNGILSPIWVFRLGDEVEQKQMERQMEETFPCINFRNPGATPSCCKNTFQNLLRTLVRTHTQPKSSGDDKRNLANGRSAWNTAQDFVAISEIPARIREL